MKSEWKKQLINFTEKKMKKKILTGHQLDDPNLIKNKKKCKHNPTFFLINLHSYEFSGIITFSSSNSTSILLNIKILLIY